MDGNNRWAKREGVPGPAGHRAGVEAVRGMSARLSASRGGSSDPVCLQQRKLGSTQPEVRALLALLSRYLRNEVRELHKDGIRMRFIGQRERFSERLQRLMRSPSS